MLCARQDGFSGTHSTHRAVVSCPVLRKHTAALLLVRLGTAASSFNRERLR